MSILESRQKAAQARQLRMTKLATTSKKVAELLAESKVTFSEVDSVLENSKLFLTVQAIPLEDDFLKDSL